MSIRMRPDRAGGIDPPKTPIESARRLEKRPEFG
jgi:hypothetical protein